MNDIAARLRRVGLPAPIFELAAAEWDNVVVGGGHNASQRDAIAMQFIELIGGYAPDITDCIEEHDVLGRPDVEARIGLTGGDIFQGETMPDQMWEHRLTPDIGIGGFSLRGAATPPAGSVIGLNGRNPAAAVLGRPVT